MEYTSNILEFSKSKGIEDLLKGFADYYNQHKAVNMGKSVSFDTSVSFEEKTEKLHKNIEDAISKISGVNSVGFAAEVEKMNPTYQWAMYAVIGAMIDPVIADSVKTNFYRFMEVRNGGLGDSFSFDIKPNELFLTTKAGNGKRHVFAQRQFNGQAHLIPENHMITVDEDLFRILAGKKNLAEYALKIALSVEEQIMDEVYNAINDTYASLPTEFKEAAFTADAFVKLAQRVKAFNGGQTVSVFGTQLALSKVLPTLGSNINFNVNSGLGAEYTTNGYIGRMGKVDLFELEQKADWASSDYALKLDDDRLYFVSSGQEKLIKLCLAGSTISYADGMIANADLRQRQTLHKQYAVGLISNATYGIMDLG